MSLPIDYGPVDPLAEDPRYTSLEKVRERLGIGDTDTSFDDRLTEAIVAGEYAIDVHLGRSFPDGEGVEDESLPGPVQGIPIAVIVAATQTAVAVYKEADAPTGSAGSEEFLGALEVAEVARRIVTRSIVLKGFQVGAGFGVA